MGDTGIKSGTHGQTNLANVNSKLLRLKGVPDRN